MAERDEGTMIEFSRVLVASLKQRALRGLELQDDNFGFSIRIERRRALRQDAPLSAADEL